jgi:hypothetical protein
MIEIKRPEEKRIVVIRTASPQEFSNYEKWKLEGIDPGAQVNKLEAIKVTTPSRKVANVSIDDKVATVELGELALKDKITAKEISPEELFIIECALRDSEESK